MRKKLLFVLLTVVCAICCSFALSACFDNPDNVKNEDGNGEIVAGEHKLISVAETKATCTMNGNIAYYICSDCGKWLFDKGGLNEIIDKSSVLTFKELTPVAETKATCTADGNKAYYICDDCGKWFLDREGKEEITDKTSVILQKGHKLTLVKAKEETCTSDGNTAHYTCEGCDKLFADENGESEITDKASVVILKKGHDMTLVEEKAETCTEDGNIAYYTCGNCNKFFSDEEGKNKITDKTSVVVAKHHSLTAVDGKAASCTEDGNFAYFACKGCEKWFWDKNGKTEITNKSNVVLLKGHKLTHFEEKAASCTEDGNFEYYSCSVCDKWFSDKICENEITDKTGVVRPKTGHKLTFVAEKAETCTEDGNTDYYACGNCNKFYSDEEAANEIYDKTSVMISKHHNLTAVAEKKVSCTEDGNFAYFSCDVCEKWYWDKDAKNEITVKTDAIIAKGHKFESGVCKVCSQPQPPTEGLIYTDKGSYCELAEIGSATGTDIIIASVFNDKPVTSIGNQAFADCEEIEFVMLPDSITSIGNSAFSRCKNLESIKISDNLTYIGKEAFYYCHILKELTFPEGVTYIGDMAFFDCWKMTDLTIPNTVEYLGYNAFDGCHNLQYNEYDNGLYLGNDGNPYTVLVKAKRTGITSCIINENTKLVHTAFSGCENLTGITIPDSVVFIGYAAFTHCKNLASISIPQSVKIISQDAFSYCTALTSVIISEGVSEISVGAFGQCRALKSIIIPESVEVVEEGAFVNCGVLTIYCKVASKPAEWSEYWNMSNRPVVWNYQDEE